MLTYPLFIASFYFGLLAFFLLVQKPLFIIYNNKASNLGKMTAADVADIYRHGIKTDLITTAYFTALPLFAGLAKLLIPGFGLRIFMTVYCAAVALAVGLATVSDTALYKFWQFKLDRSVLAYLHSLKGAMASVSTAYIVVALAAWLLVSAVVFAFIATLSTSIAPLVVSSLSGFLTAILAPLEMLVGAAILFAIIRGLGRRPNNPSVAYYSNNTFYNHCALNPLYSFIYSLSVKVKFKDEFRFFPADECERIVKPLYPTSGTPQIRLLNTTRPNVLFVVWESLGARFVESLGGAKNVTPNLDRLAKDGVMFTRVDAGSFRTDRGLVCLLSGFPGLPTASIIRMTKKLPALPALPRVFQEMGYETTAVHGGDLAIFHKKEYYLTIGHDRIVAQEDFPADSPTCKWGVHDGVVMNWLYDDIMEKTRRGAKWFTTFQTLSSHETFEVPYSRIPDDEIANAFAYVDHCFGELVDRLKTSPAWKDLLIVVVGDHGCNSGEPLARNEYAHIPLILLGGAVKEPRRIDTIMSQADTAAMLLGQLDLPHSQFPFSRDTLADTYVNQFSLHTYNNGFMVRNADGYTVFDNASRRAIDCPDETRETMGKAILQTLYNAVDELDDQLRSK